MFKRLRENWLHITLIIMLVLSFILFYFYVQRPLGLLYRLQEQFPSQEEQVAERPENRNYASQSISQTFSPRQIVHQTANELTLSINSQEIQKTIESLQNDKDLRLINRTNYGEKEINSWLEDKGNWLFIQYNDRLNLKTVNFLFDDLREDWNEQNFNYIMISLDNQSEDQIYFIDSLEQVMVTGHLSEGTIATLNQQISENSDWLKAERFQLESSFVYLPNEEVKLAEMSYIIERRPNSFYLNQLFQDTSTLYDLSNEDYIRYSSAQRELTINRDTSIIQYQNVNSDILDGSGSYMERAYIQMNELEQWSSDWRFYNLNQDRRLIVFRRYLNDLPIFGEVDYGRSAITMEGGSVMNLQTNSRNVRTPVTDLSKPITLMSGLRVVNLLSRYYNLSDIQNISLGYSWEESDKAESLARFVPGWFVQYRNHWYSLDEMMEVAK